MKIKYKEEGYNRTHKYEKNISDYIAEQLQTWQLGCHLEEKLEKSNQVIGKLVEVLLDKKLITLDDWDKLFPYQVSLPYNYEIVDE
jgi:hypothetical protein